MMLHKLIHAGFSGLWVDQFAYPNATSPEAELSSVLTTVPVRSADGRFIFFDLRSFAAKVIEEEATTSRPELFARHPIEMIPDGGFYGEEHDQARRGRWAAKKAGLILRNELNIPRSVEVWATLETRGPGQIMIAAAQANDVTVILGVRDYKRKIVLPAQSQVRLSFSCDCRRVEAPGDSVPSIFVWLTSGSWTLWRPAMTQGPPPSRCRGWRNDEVGESRPAGHGRNRRRGVD